MPKRKPPNELSAHPDEQKRLEELYSLKIIDTLPEECYDRLVMLAIELLDIPICYIAFIDEKRQWFKSEHGLKKKQMPRAFSFCNETIKNHEPLIIQDTLLDKRFAHISLVQEDPNIRFYAGVPLTSPEGYNVGTFCLADTTPRKLTSKQLNILLTLANIAKDELSLRYSNHSLEKIKKKLEQRNSLIRKVFSFYMSDEVIDMILQSPTQLKLGGKETKVTILFSDLRNFTPLSEHLPAEQLVSLLNAYFSKMVNVIEKHKGTVASFIGDAIMVLFGAPYSDKEDSLRAIQCALEMQSALVKFNHADKRRDCPHLEMGIGVNTGMAVVGNTGSKKRMQYSAIGSSVNLSSRIQGLSIGGQILISAATYQEVAEYIDINGYLRVKVKGIESPITIYDVAKLVRSKS